MKDLAFKQAFLGKIVEMGSKVKDKKFSKTPDLLVDSITRCGYMEAVLEISTWFKKQLEKEGGE